MVNDLDDVKNFRMLVFSWDYQNLCEAEHWFLMARAFFDCSFYLFAETIKGNFDQNYHRALVAVSTFTHSVELFLKAAIAQSAQKIKTTHNLDDLYKQYQKHYPGKKFAFEADIISIVEQCKNIPLNEFARYPTNQAGQPWPGNPHVDIAIWYEQLNLFKKDFDRLKPLLKERFPTKSNPKL